MSLSAELKDFTSGFKSGVDMYTKMADAKSLRDYRRAKTSGADDMTPGFLGIGSAGSGGGGSDLDKLQANIGQKESGGRYNAIGPKTKYGRAYGKYQVLETNIPGWTKEFLGKSMTPQEFLEDHEAQEKVAKGKMAQYYSAYGNTGDVASMWFSGKPLSKVSKDASDGYTTVGGYVGDVTKGLGAPTGTTGGAITAAPMGAPPAETALPMADEGAPTPPIRPTNFGTNDPDEKDDADTASAMAKGGMVRGYAAGGKVKDDDFIVSDPKLNTKFDPTFRKSLLDLQKRATAAGIKTHLISGVRTLDDQKELYANYLAGQSGKPLPYPKRGAVALAAKPGTSPHEKGMAADLAVDDPRDRARLVELSKSDPNLRHIANDPNHFELNTKGGGGEPTAVAANGAKPSPMPPEPEDTPEREALAASGGGGQPEEGDEGNAKALADATERARANQANAAYAQQSHQAQLLQEGAANEQALGQEAAARGTPPLVQAQAEPEEVEAAAGGGMIKGYAPGGAVNPYGYSGYVTPTVIPADQALAPAVSAAAQAPPVAPTPAVPTTPAPAPAPAPAAADPNAGLEAKGSPARAMQDAGYGNWALLDPMMAGSSRPGATAGAGSVGATKGWNPANPGSVYPAAGGAAAAKPAGPPPVKATDRGSVWNPETKAWEAGAGYSYNASTKGWEPTANSNAAKMGYAEGGEVEDDEEAVPTSPAPAQSAMGDARTRAPQAAPAPLPQPPPNLVGDALHDGLVHLTKMFGLDRVGAVQDPDAQARIQAFNNGAGAADGEAMHAVHRAVDPNNQMTQQQLAGASVAAIKAYYDNKGQPEAGAKAIGEIMQHQKAVSAHFSANAQQAFQQGDVNNGLKFLKAAYDQVPDGQHIDAMIQQDGTVAYRLTDSHSGRVIHQGIANAQQLSKLAEVGSTGTPYVKAVATSAARSRTPPSPEGGSGAYLAQRQADLTSGVSQGAVPVGTQVAQADASTATDAAVDAPPRKPMLAPGGHAGPRTDAPVAEPAVPEASTTQTPPKLSAAPPGKPAGLLEPGNIDLAHRQVYKIPGGGIATVHSMGIEEDGKQILIPTIIDGQPVSKDEAIAHYHETGENLGKFDTVAHANQYAQDLHAAQERYYKSGSPPPAEEAVPTDGTRPRPPVPDIPIVRPETHTVTPTKVEPAVIPKELTTPVEAKPRTAEQDTVPEVVPIEPKSVDDQYDLTPRTFSEPQPNPDTYFANYNKWRPLARTKGDRKALVTEYTQANTAYDNAEAAWNSRKAQFDAEENKRLSIAEAAAGRGQTRENTRTEQEFGISKDKRKEVLTANEKKQERADKLSDIEAAQQAGLNAEEVKRIVKLKEDERAAARAGDAEAQKRLDKIDDDIATQKVENARIKRTEAVATGVRAEQADTADAAAARKQQEEVDKEFRALSEKNRTDALIKPPNSDERRALDDQLAAAPKNEKSPLEKFYATFADPETGEPYLDEERRTKGLGAGTINGIRELTRHIMHANGVSVDAALGIVSQLLNSDTDDEDKQFFQVGRPDKAGNSLVKVPGYPAIRIAPEMAGAVAELRDATRTHLIKTVAARKVREGLANVASENRWGTVKGAVDTAGDAASHILFPTPPVTGNTPVRRADKPFPKPTYVPPGSKDIDETTKLLFPELQ